MAMSPWRPASRKNSLMRGKKLWHMGLACACNVCGVWCVHRTYRVGAVDRPGDERLASTPLVTHTGGTNNNNNNNNNNNDNKASHTHHHMPPNSRPTARPRSASVGSFTAFPSLSTSTVPAPNSSSAGGSS